LHLSGITLPITLHGLRLLELANDWKIFEALPESKTEVAQLTRAERRGFPINP
jgi:hypothetical protein